MISNISFGSMFNPERVSRKNIEDTNNNPENNLERLKYGQEAEPSKSFPLQELLGRSLVRTKQMPTVELLDDDMELLSRLDCKKYGFCENSNDFWVHSKKQNADGTHSTTMGDGRIQNGISRADFIKDLVKEGVQGVNVAGTKKDGNGSISATIIYNKEKDYTMVYTSKLNTAGESINSCFDCCIGGFQSFKDFLNATLDDFDCIYGATVWQ